MQNLRGKKAKTTFVQNYENIKVLAYRVLLNGDTRKNQCGGKLTDKYYHFSATCKKTLKTEYFFLGYDCAHQLMQMLHIPINSIKLFNPFRQECSSAKPSNHSDANDNHMHFTALGIELFELANLICVGLKLKNTDIIYNIEKELYENPLKDPPPINFKKLNTILIKYKNTIQNIVDDLQKNNKEFRKFDFTAARDYLKEYFKEIRCEDKIQF
ncbi:hypothetical protein [uncultured Helicobacter sp.]|uniref:hypothetical protein n=1 Tax=uncultured Helicobacter sp. TaxID=175537 RepID=UPI003750C89D